MLSSSDATRKIWFNPISIVLLKTENLTIQGTHPLVNELNSEILIMTVHDKCTKANSTKCFGEKIQYAVNSGPEINFKTKRFNRARGCWESVYKSAVYCINMAYFSLHLALYLFSQNKTAALAGLQH